MKKFVIGLGLVLMGTAAMAQDVKDTLHTQKKEHREKKSKEKAPNKEKSPEVKADQLTQQMIKEYALNDDQGAKIKTVNLNYFQKRAHQKSEGSVSKTLNSDRDLQYKAIMTRSQYKTYQEKEEARKEELKAKKAAEKEEAEQKEKAEKEKAKQAKK